MALHLSGSAAYLSATTGLTPATTCTFMGWSRYNNNGLYRALLEHRPNIIGYYIDTSGVLALDNDSTTVSFSSSPAQGSLFAWYLKISGSGSNQVEAGWRQLGDAAWVTATHTAGFSGSPTGLRLAGTPFDTCDQDIGAFKAWDAALSGGEVDDEWLSYEPRRFANLNRWIPMIHDTASEAVKDLSGNGRNLTINGTIGAIAGPPIVWGAPSQIVARSGLRVSAGAASATGAAVGAGGSTALASGATSAAAAGAATGASTNAAAGSVSGLAAAAAVALAIFAGSGASDGQATAAGVASSIAAATGTASAGASVGATGQSTSAAGGASAGAATAAGTAAATTLATGSSTGVGDAQGVGAARFSGVGASAGVATASGAGIGLVDGGGTGSAAGLATVAGAGASTVAGAGTVSAGASALAAGAAAVAGAGSADAGATASATGQGIFAGAAAAPGHATVQAIGAPINAGTGASSSVAAAQAAGSEVTPFPDTPTADERVLAVAGLRRVIGVDGSRKRVLRVEV